MPVHQLEATIANDPEFSLRVLGLANSAFYSQRHTIASLRSALVVLGAETVRRLAATQLSRALMANPRHGDPSIWRHAQATGIAAQMIAEAHRQVEPLQAFVAGLLHDIGVSAILACGDASTDFELHAAIGAEAAELLGLADCLVSAIRQHHHDPSNPSIDPLNASLVIANEVAIRAGYAHDAEASCDDGELQPALDLLGLEPADTDAFRIGLASRVEALETELGFGEEAHA